MSATVERIRRALILAPNAYRVARWIYRRSLIRWVHPRDHVLREYARRVRDLAGFVSARDLAGGVLTDDGRWFVVTWDGLRMFFDPSGQRGPLGDGQGLHDRKSQRQDPLERYLLEQVRPGSVYMDVGANNGYWYTLKVARRCESARIFAFEPDPGILRHLRANLEANALTDRVRVVDQALVDRAGMAVLTSNVGAMGYVARGGEQGVRVRCGTLDEFVERERLDRIDVVKVDIEGREHDFVRGATRALREHRPLILIEVIDALLRRATSSEDALLAHLRDLGYTSYRVHGTHDVVAIQPGRHAEPGRDWATCLGPGVTRV